MRFAGANPTSGARYTIGSPALTDIWVDATRGSDGNSGATRAQALATISAAWNRIPQGSTLTTTGYRILLCAGTYRDRMPANGWMASRYGTFQCPIIIQSADGAGKAIMSSVDMFDCHYIYLIGVRLEANGAESGDVIHVAGSHHILIRQVEAAGTGDIQDYASPQEALKVNQCQYVYVEDSDISGAWGNALDYVAVQYGHIVGSRIHDSLDWCVCLKGGSASLEVECNEIYNSSTGGVTAGQGTGFEYMVSPWLHYEAYDLKFVNNLVHNIDGASGIGVNGGYNILFAYNTLYKVGKTDHTMEFVHGLRGCGAGDASTCAANLRAGGWGTARTGWENQQPIPNRNVFVYNNIVYNPPGYQTQWQQFAFAPPLTPANDSNIPSPSRADTNLQIRGNIIWNGPADMPLSGDYIPSTSTCNAEQLVRENAINTLQPQLIDPAHGNFRPVSAGNVFTSTVFPIPSFPGGDRAQPPLAPQGDLSNIVSYDYDGLSRTSPSPPGAFSGGDGFVVTSCDPPNGAVSVPATANVTITFNKTAQPGANYTNVTLKRGDVKINVTKTIDGTKLKLKPNATLSYNTTYTVSMPKDGVKNGTAALSRDFVSRFTTAIAPKKAAALNVSITTSSSLVKQDFTVKGRLVTSNTALPAQNVTLQRSTNNATWTNLTRTTTNATGWYTFSRNETTAGTYYYRTTYAGNATYVNATSNVARVTVTKIPTTLTATAPASATINTNFTVKGRLTSNITKAGIPSQTIVLYRWNGTAWVSTRNTTTNATGWFSITLKEARSGTYQYLPKYAGTTVYAPSNTQASIKVTVKGK